MVFRQKRARIPISYKSGEGDMHRYRSLRTKLSQHSRERRACGSKAPLVQHRKKPLQLETVWGMLFSFVFILDKFICFCTDVAVWVVEINSC